MRVLLVEPNAGLRRIFSQELEEAGFSTVGAESLEDPMRLAADDPPDVIVLKGRRLGYRGVRREADP